MLRPLALTLLAAVLVVACDSSRENAARDTPEMAFERLEGDLGLGRPSPGVEEYYGSLYAGGGNSRNVSLWTLPGESVVLPAALLFVLDEPAGFDPDDVDRLALEVESAFSSAQEPSDTDGGDVWIEGAGPNGEGVTVAVHRGLGYMIIGSEQVGARMLDALRSSGN